MKTTTATLLASVILISCATAQDLPKMHTRLAVGVPTQYFFRGILQQNGGIIVQPSIAVGRSDIDVGVPLGWEMGLWNSLHEGQTGTGAAGGSPAWYEAQFHLGVNAEIAEDIEVGMAYAVLHSPGRGFRIGAARATQELRFHGAWDDSARHEDSEFKGLHPYGELVFELAGGRDAGRDLGIYLEFGVEPEFEVTEEIDVTVPVRVGLSLNDYYEDATGSDDTFGFLGIGARGTMPLCDKSSVFGPWELGASVDILLLGGNTKDFNNRDSFELLAGIDLSLSW